MCDDDAKGEQQTRWYAYKKNNKITNKHTFADPMSLRLAASLIAFSTLFSSLWTSAKASQEN
jgi:hypothetical protein